MTKKICIIGCGWLGFPLAKTFVQKGVSVNGSTTSETKLKRLTSEGIEPFLLKFSSEGVTGKLNDCLENCDTLVLNIPPGLRGDPSKDYIKQMSFLIPLIEASSIQYVLFISSTSVYEDSESFPEITGLTATSTTSNTSKQLVATEELFQNNPNFNTTILRFSGLFGPDRHPATFLSGKTNLKNGNAPVNLIHLDDCIGIIHAIIEQKQWNQVYNASTTPHPTKNYYYNHVCRKMNLELALFNSNHPSKGKIITSSKLVQDLNYKFKIKL